MGTLWPVPIRGFSVVRDIRSTLYGNCALGLTVSVVYAIQDLSVWFGVMCIPGK